MLKSSLNYLMGQMIIMLSGLISFPILARTFTVEQFGALSLLNLTILLLSGVSKAGLTKAAIRFYPKTDESEHVQNSYFSNLVFGEIFVSLIISIGLGLSIFIIQYPDASNAFYLAIGVSATLFIRSNSMILLSILQAEQKSALYSYIQISIKYGGLFLALTWIWLSPEFSLPAFYFGFAIIEFIILIMNLSAFLKRYKLNIKLFDFNLIKKYAKYGIPLLSAELIYIILHQSDRYILEFYRSTYEVGIYSVAFNFATIIQQLFTAPISMALMPFIMQKYKQDGPEAVKGILTNVLKYFVIIAIPIIAVGSIEAESILVLLAGEKYHSAAQYVPILLLSVLLYGVYVIFITGFMLDFSTKKATAIMGAATFLNLGLNMYFIPEYGIWGAAGTTFAGYLMLTVLIKIYSPEKYNPKLGLKLIFQLILATSSLVSILWILHFENIIINLVLVPIGALILYLTIIVILNKDIRKDGKSALLKVSQMLNSRKKKIV